CRRALIRARRRPETPSSPTAYFQSRRVNGRRFAPQAIRHIRDRRVLTSIKFPARCAAASVLTFIPYLGRHLIASIPLQRHAYIPGYPSMILDDFDPDLVSARTEVLRPKLIDLVWHAGQRAFPACLLLDDGAALVRAQLVRKTVHLYLGPAVGHRALDDL